MHCSRTETLDDLSFPAKSQQIPQRRIGMGRAHRDGRAWMVMRCRRWERRLRTKLRQTHRLLLSVPRSLSEDNSESSEQGRNVRKESGIYECFTIGRHQRSRKKKQKTYRRNCRLGETQRRIPHHRPSAYWALLVLVLVLVRGSNTNPQKKSIRYFSPSLD